MAMLRLILILLLAVARVQADDISRANPTADVVASTTVLATSGTNQTRTTTIDISASERWGIDWQMSSAATINVQVQYRSSNAYAGPYAYATSVSGVTLTTTTAISTSPGSVQIFPGATRWLEVKLVNNGAASVTVTRCTLFKY